MADPDGVADEHPATATATTTATATATTGNNDEDFDAFDPFGGEVETKGSEVAAGATTEKGRKKKKVKKKKKKKEKKKGDAKAGTTKPAEKDDRNITTQPTAQASPSEDAGIANPPERTNYAAFMDPPPEEANLVATTAGGLAMDSLMSGRILPFDRKAYLHGLHTRLSELCPRLQPPTAIRSGAGPRPNKVGEGIETATGIVADWDAWFNQTDLPDDDAETIERQMAQSMLRDDSEELENYYDEETGRPKRCALPASANRSDYNPVETPFGTGHLVGPVRGGIVVEVELAFGVAFIRPSLLKRGSEIVDSRSNEEQNTTSDLIEDLGISLSKVPKLPSKEAQIREEQKLKEAKTLRTDAVEEEHSSDEERKEDEDDEDPFEMEQDAFASSGDMNANKRDGGFSQYHSLEQKEDFGPISSMPSNVWAVIDEEDEDPGEDCD